MSKHTRVRSLQEATAKFSEVVRRARTEGPQIMTVHGKEAVAVSAVKEVVDSRETGRRAGGVVE